MALMPDNKAGRYELLSHLAMGQRLHSPGDVVDLTHDDASMMLESGTARPACEESGAAGAKRSGHSGIMSKRGAYELPTLEEYVAAGYRAEYYPIFMANETSDAPFDALDAMSEGKDPAPTPEAWHDLARADGRTAVLVMDDAADTAAAPDGTDAAPAAAGDEASQEPAAPEATEASAEPAADESKDDTRAGRRGRRAR